MEIEYHSNATVVVYLCEECSKGANRDILVSELVPSSNQ